MGQSGVELSDSKNYRCGACGVTYSTASAIWKHKINKHIKVKERFLCALWGKEFPREANMESHIPPQTPAKSKNDTAQRRDHEIGDDLLSGGSWAAEKQGELYRLPEQENYPMAIRLDLRDAYGRLSSKNQ